MQYIPKILCFSCLFLLSAATVVEVIARCNDDPNTVPCLLTPNQVLGCTIGQYAIRWMDADNCDRLHRIYHSVPTSIWPQDQLNQVITALDLFERIHRLEAQFRPK